MRKPARTKDAPRRKSSASVAELLDKLAHPQRPLIDKVRALIVNAVPSASESIKWNAPSFSTAEHFATFHLRARTGVQLVLHLGAKARTDVDLRAALEASNTWVEWKGPDRAIVTVRSAAHLREIRADLTRLIRAWSDYVD